MLARKKTGTNDIHAAHGVEGTLQERQKGPKLPGFIAVLIARPDIDCAHHRNIQPHRPYHRMFIHFEDRILLLPMKSVLCILYFYDRHAHDVCGDSSAAQI
jgi:hypothetical protein